MRQTRYQKTAFPSRISDLAAGNCLLGLVPPRNQSKPGVFSFIPPDFKQEDW